MTIYFDPRDPASSCLEPGVSRWFVYPLLFIGGCWLFVFIYLTQVVARGKPLPLVKGVEPPSAVESCNFTLKDLSPSPRS